MKVIDSDSYAAARIETLCFPGGEPHVKVPKFEGDVLVHLKLRTWEQVGFAALVLDALMQQVNVCLHTFIPYFPGARQDKLSEGLAPFTVGVMANLLGRTWRTWVLDPHSHVLSGQLDYMVTMPSDLGLQSLRSVVGIIAPDEGALGRAHDYRDAFHPKAELIQCSKKRNPKNGRLSDCVVPKIEKVGRYVIVDDICDGGGTFNLLADAFFSDPVGVKCSLDMFVSHGIFSKGLDAINPYIEHITTTDSWCQLPSNDRLTVLPLLPNFLKFLEK